MKILICLFKDYFVLVPEAYYEGTILVEKVKRPCQIGENGLCRHYRYPNLTDFYMVRGEGGFISKEDDREPLREFLEDSQVKIVIPSESRKTDVFQDSITLRIFQNKIFCFHSNNH